MTLEQRENARLQKVVKSNALIQRARYDLSIQQYKILTYVISRIKPEDKEFYIQQFTLKELCEVCGLSQHRPGTVQKGLRLFQRRFRAGCDGIESSEALSGGAGGESGEI